METYDTLDFMADNGRLYWAEKSGEQDTDSTFDDICEYIDFIRDYQESQI